MKKLRFIMTAVLITALLSGCSTSEVTQDALFSSSPSSATDADSADRESSSEDTPFTKPSPSNEVVELDKIKFDLESQEPIFSENSFEIQNLEIDKRQTTIEDKIDIIYLSGSAENEAVRYDFSYKLTYNLYNEGWILDVISEQESNYLPLMTPSREVIESIIPNVYPYPNYDCCEIYSVWLYDESVFSITLEDLENGATVESSVDWEEYTPYAIPEDLITDDAEFKVTTYYYNLFPYAREELYYGYTLVFDDSKLEWVYDRGTEVTEERKEYDLEGVWVGQDYSLEVTMSDKQSLNSITAKITDTQTGELVYSGGINDSTPAYGGIYNIEIVNRYEPYTVLGREEDREEIFNFSDEGVYYYYSLGFTQYSEDFYLEKVE